MKQNNNFKLDKDSRVLSCKLDLSIYCQKKSYRKTCSAVSMKGVQLKQPFEENFANLPCRVLIFFPDHVRSRYLDLKAIIVSEGNGCSKIEFDHLSPFEQNALKTWIDESLSSVKKEAA